MTLPYDLAPKHEFGNMRSYLRLDNTSLMKCVRNLKFFMANHAYVNRFFCFFNEMRIVSL